MVRTPAGAIDSVASARCQTGVVGSKSGLSCCIALVAKPCDVAGLASASSDIPVVCRSAPFHIHIRQVLRADLIAAHRGLLRLLSWRRMDLGNAAVGRSCTKVVSRSFCDSDRLEEKLACPCAFPYGRGALCLYFAPCVWSRSSPGISLRTSHPGLL